MDGANPVAEEDALIDFILHSAVNGQRAPGTPDQAMPGKFFGLRCAWAISSF